MPDTKEKNKNQSKVIPHGELDKRRVSQRKRRRRIVLLLAAVLAAVLLTVFFVKGGYEKILDVLGIERNISVTPVITEIECELKGEPVIGGAGGTTMIYDEQGVTGYDKYGKWKWNEACTLANPVVSYCGGSVVFTDVGGTVVYAFGADGMVWRYGSDKKIKAVFGGAGYICVIHEESEYLSAITVFEQREKSSELKELFTRKFGSHYMITGAVSPDGKQLAVAGVYSKGGDAAGIVSFLRMADGEIYANEVMEEGAYIKTFYAADGKMFALNSDSARILYHSLTTSSKGDINREIWNRGSGQELITGAVLVNGKYLTASFAAADSERTTVKGYDTDGKESLNFEVSGNIIGMHSVGDALLLYTNKHIYLYNEKGLRIGTQEAGFVIKGAVCTDSRHVAVYGEGRVLSVSFQ